MAAVEGAPGTAPSQPWRCRVDESAASPSVDQVPTTTHLASQYSRPSSASQLFLSISPFNLVHHTEYVHR